MKILTIVVTAISSLIYAVETTQFLNENHRFYIEPDVAYGIPHKENYADSTLKEYGFLLGCNLGYEYFASNALYTSLDASFSLANRFAEIDNYSQQEKTYQNRLEGTFGYTLQESNLFIAPFIGGGGYFLKTGGEDLYLSYIPIGFRGEYRTSNLSVGIRAMQIRYVHMWKQYGNVSFSRNIFGRDTYGYELSFPLSWKVTLPEGRWYATLEPYYLKLSSTVAYLGGRIAGMYNF